MNEREVVQLDLPTTAHYVLILTSEYPIFKLVLLL